MVLLWAPTATRRFAGVCVAGSCQYQYVPNDSDGLMFLLWVDMGRRFSVLPFVLQGFLTLHMSSSESR